MNRRKRYENIRSDTFAGYHPLVVFLYLIFMVLASIMMTHPVLLLLSFAGALSYRAYQGGGKVAATGVLGTILLVLFSAAFNALFSHQGETALFYLNNGNPIMLESIWFGMTTGFMLATVIQWFACFNQVMTSDKIIYLFGKLIPVLSLILSMIFRFVPRFVSQAEAIRNAQKGLGRRDGTSFRRKIRNGIRVLSILVTWELEHGIDTADSMRSRGFGWKGRTSYHRYHIEGRDVRLLLYSLLSCCVLFYAIGTKQIAISFFPSVQISRTTATAAAAHLIFAFACMLPTIINWMEDLKWNYLKSKI